MICCYPCQGCTPSSEIQCCKKLGEMVVVPIGTKIPSGRYVMSVPVVKVKIVKELHLYHSS